MSIGSSTVAMARRSGEQAFEVQLALAGFLTGYSGNTRLAYQQDLRQFASWCSNQDLELLACGESTLNYSPGGSSIAERPGRRSDAGCRPWPGSTGTASRRNSSLTIPQRTCDDPGCGKSPR